MEVFLYNSTVCRLCGEENENGSLLYFCEENNQSLSDIINTYLPLKVSDDGQLPRTICPGCTIQLEATVEFLNLIIKGQKIIRDLYQREKQYKKSILKKEERDVLNEKVVYEEINTTDKVYPVEHSIALQVAGLEKPKRKRGRPPKKAKTPEELAQEAEERAKEIEAKNSEKDDEERAGKRRRRTPTRFKEAVQGKELERIFKEEGVIDGEESDHEIKANVDADPKQISSKESEVIGHMETSGELVVVGKGRGRPKGRLRPTREQCAICNMVFSCVGRYMSHVARHGPVLYRCGCGADFHTRLLFTEHQRETAHTGQTVVADRGERKAHAQEAEVNDSNSEVKDQTRFMGEVTSADKTADNDQTTSQPTPLTDSSEQTEMKTEASIDVNVPIPTTVDSSNSVNDIGLNKEEMSTNNVEVEKREEEPQIQQAPGKPRLKCNLCDKTFSNRQSKSLHMKARHAGERPYACEECGATFAYPRSRALHALSHRRTSAANGFACDLCGKVLNHPSSVVYHKQAQHAQQRFVCAACGKRFRHRQLLRRHQLVHSQHRPYGCKICNASFKTKSNLLNHQLLHSGEKKFSCEICKHKFAHKTSLTLHMRWHTGVKPFSCKTCGKSFSQKGNLSEHERIHSGEKPYQCGVCVRRFTTSSQHRLHARRHMHHRVSMESVAAGVSSEAVAGGARCGVCGRLFPEPAALARHARRHHRPHDRNTQPHKQISLLVSDKTEPRVEQLEQVEEERVIYVAYDVGDADAPHLRILDPNQAADLEESKVLSACSLYSGTSLLMKSELEEEEPALEQLEQVMEHEQHHVQRLSPVVINTQDHIPVTDEQGNPLHFTMQDGTRLAITSADGSSLQVITHDGQTIPVEINGYADEEEMESTDAIVHQLNLQKSMDSNSSPVTYFTIV